MTGNSTAHPTANPSAAATPVRMPGVNVEAVILAAGEGVRMRSSLPKALHPIGGRPMLARVIDAVDALRPGKIHLVVGHGGERVKAALAAMADDAPRHAALNWVTQAEQLGTGHAVMQALPAIARDASVLLLYGDTPLISAETLVRLVAAGSGGDGNKLGLLTAEVEDPSGLGRIVRDRGGKVARVVEEKDADDAERQIRECNAGVIAAPAKVIADALARIGNDNAQGEYYLTDIIGHAAAAGVEITACQPAAADEVFGVNTQADLARAERIFQSGQARRLLDAGVCLRDPARFDMRGNCTFGRDCVVDVNVILEGEVMVGDGCFIGAGSVIRHSLIGDGSVIHPHCVLDFAVVGRRCVVGPFARLRPRTLLENDVHIGNFVEVKQSHIGSGSKANHLSYLGDSALGRAVNIGAGVITCNYDGADKHPTRIGDEVFVGSNSQLVAPLTIGDGATIGAGSTITEDVAAQTLAVARARQKTLDGWTRPSKKPREGK